MKYPDTHTKFKHGDPVCKSRGSQWKGKVVGWYSTTLTPEGYAVESNTEHGSVQIYPAAALEQLPYPSGKESIMSDEKEKGCDPRVSQAALGPAGLERNQEVPMSAPDGPWRTCWLGSGPERGDHIRCGRERVAYLPARDGTWGLHDEASAIVFIHNSAVARLTRLIEAATPMDEPQSHNGEYSVGFARGWNALCRALRG